MAVKPGRQNVLVAILWAGSKTELNAKQLKPTKNHSRCRPAIGVLGSFHGLIASHHLEDERCLAVLPNSH